MSWRSLLILILFQSLKSMETIFMKKVKSVEPIVYLTILYQCSFLSFDDWIIVRNILTSGKARWRVCGNFVIYIYIFFFFFARKWKWKLLHGILQARILECYSLFQGIFQTQGSNPGLLHCRPPRITGVVANPFSRGSSQQVICNLKII